MEGEGPELPWEEGPEAEEPCPLSVEAVKEVDLGNPMGCPWS